jgi:hypothetical protein
VAPEVGEVFEGTVLTQENLAEIDPEEWPMQRFRPDGSQIGGALLLIGLGLAATLAIDRLGRIRSQGEPATKGG